MTEKYVVWYCELYKSFLWDFEHEGIHDFFECCTEINRFDNEKQAYDLCNFLNGVYLND